MSWDLMLPVEDWSKSEQCCMHLHLGQGHEENVGLYPINWVLARKFVEAEKAVK